MILAIAMVVWLLLFAMRAPLFMCFLYGGSLMFIYGFGLPPETICIRLVGSIDSFTFMAIAPFILSGSLMARGGSSRALVDMMEAFLGRVPGGLGMAAVLSCSIFAALSGSTVATSAAIGSMMVFPLAKRGYPLGFSSAIIATAGTLGIMIPPSITLVIYGGLTMESVPALFMAGVIPGLIITASLSGLVVFMSRNKGYVSGDRYTWRQKWRAFFRAVPAIGQIAVIMVPIYTGISTPTEAAAISVIYAFFVSRYYYKELTRQQIWDAVIDSTKTTAMILIIVASGITFGAADVAFGLADIISDFVTHAGFNWWQFLMVVNAIWFVLGCFIDTVTTMVLVIPLIIPVFASLGISPIHFGVLSVLNTELALITPPVCLNVYVMSGISKVPMETIIKYIWPFIIVLIGDLLLITYLPELSLVLPTAMNLIK